MPPTYSDNESPFAEAERFIAEIDEILEGLEPSQLHFRPSLESCRNALITLILLIEDWPSLIS